MAKKDHEDVDPAQTTNKLVGSVMESIDLEALSESLAREVAKRVLANVNVCVLADQLFEKYGGQLQSNITAAILRDLQLNFWHCIYEFENICF